MTKHTPGPWRLFNADLKNPKFYQKAGPITFAYNIRESDVVLAGQAPALLQTLKNLICAAENNSGAEPSLSLYHYTVSQSKAAIKAAEGDPLNDAEQQLIDDLWS